MEWLHLTEEDANGESKKMLQDSEVNPCRSAKCTRQLTQVMCRGDRSRRSRGAKSGICERIKQMSLSMFGRFREKQQSLLVNTLQTVALRSWVMG